MVLCLHPRNHDIFFIAMTHHDVYMGEYVIAKDVDVLVTESLGPCIAIGIRHGNRLSLIHQWGPSHGGDKFLKFFRDLSARIPKDNRIELHPIVAGGHHVDDYFQEDADVNVGTDADRAWVAEELAALGFGAPHLCWGPAGATSQAVELNRATSRAVVTTFNSDGTSTSQALPLPPA